MPIKLTHHPLSLIFACGLLNACVDADDATNSSRDASLPASDAGVSPTGTGSTRTTSASATTSNTIASSGTTATSGATATRDVSTGDATSTADASTPSSESTLDATSSTSETDAGQVEGMSDGSLPPVDAGETEEATSDAAGTGDVVSSGGADASTADASSEVYPEQAAIDNARVPQGFVAWEWASGLQEPRGVLVDDDGNVLVATEGNIVALWDADADGVSNDEERATIATASGLNHGIALDGGYLYASSSSTVYRWPYAATRTDLGTPETVIETIPTGGHPTRTLLFDDNYLYVSVGSGSNVDADSSRAQIRRFPIASLSQAQEFYDGELFADGLRNEVGLALDSFGQVWGVENGMDDLEDSDLGGDIHNTNPGEELNLFLESGDFYGYPYCWSEYSLDSSVGMGPGTQWWLESSDATYSDAWCQDPSNVVPPALVLPAHVAPLGIRFYNGSNFPAEYAGDALVTFHGSWNAEPAAGYKVVRVHMDESGYPTGEWEPLYEYGGASDTGPDWNERPVDLAITPDGTVLVTSDDDADRIIAIRYLGN